MIHSPKISTIQIKVSVKLKKTIRTDTIVETHHRHLLTNFNQWAFKMCLQAYLCTLYFSKKTNHHILPTCQTAPLMNIYEPHKQWLEMKSRESGHGLWETSRLQLFHLDLRVWQHCQFVLINLLWDPLWFRMWWRPNKHRCTPTAMLQTLTHTFKPESICWWSICRSSGISHRQFLDATIGSQQELGLPGNFLSAGCWDTCDPSTTCLTDWGHVNKMLTWSLNIQQW